MSLTYQPFAQTPEVNRLGKELRMNVPDGERFVSGTVGTALTVAGLARGGALRWILLLAGAALLKRSFTGHCELYHSMGIDKRHLRAGVPGNRGKRIEATVEISKPADALFRYWRDLEQLPKVMRHVKSVQKTGGQRSHWKVEGPAKRSVEWDAEIINEHEGRLIAWQSTPDSSIHNAGSVWFEPTGHGMTRVKVALEYDPPAGALGLAVADLLGNSPEADLREDLQRFKAFAERELPA